MQSNAKKFTFMLKHDEDLNISSEDLNISSEDMGVLKFHGLSPVPTVAPSAPKKSEARVIDIDEEIRKAQLAIEAEAFADSGIVFKTEEPVEKEVIQPLKIVENKEEVQQEIKEEVTTAKLELKDSEVIKKVKKKKYANNNYFGVKNHLDLFEVGQHYTDTFHNGMKSFAFHGDQKKSVHHTILGLASFFNYHKGMKATVFIDKFEGSELAKLIKPTHVEMELLHVDDDEETYEVYSCEGVDVVELYKLKHMAVKMGMDVFQDFLVKVVKDSEIIFWDLPETSSINQEKEFYLPILSVVNSLSLVIDAGAAKIKKVKEMNVFAGKYQVSVEGVLMYKNGKRA